MFLNEKHIFLKTSRELVDLCRPLERFGINHFTYQKHLDDGGRINLSNKPTWIEDYYNLKLYQSSLFEGKPSLYKPRYDVWIGEYDLPVYHHGRLYYNTTHSITITHPQKDGCEFFLFSAPSDQLDSINYLASDKDVLYHFMFYFKDKMDKSIKKCEKNMIFIPELIKQELDFLKNDNLYAKDFIELKKQFFNSTRINGYIFETSKNKEVKLTDREIDCVLHLLDNKTAERTSQLMNVSRRTVESYLENIKIKLNCKSKNDIYRKLKNHIYLSAIRQL